MHTFLLITIVTSISQQHHKNNFSPQFHTLIFQPNFVQLSTLLKSLQMTNQTLVPQSYKSHTNSTNHIATQPTGHIGYIEVPITNEKPKHYQVNNLNTLIHNVTHTYHPEYTELIPPTNYSTTTEQQTIFPTQFSLNQVYMTDTNSLPHSSSIYNVQPTSHSSQQRVFPSLPY